MAFADPKPISFYEEKFAKTDKTDAVLVVDGIKLHVNKALLSYHSDYFTTLFASNSGEKSDNYTGISQFKIDDVKFEDFATLLSLVQANPIEFEVSNVENLLELADRFVLPAAKRFIVFALQTRADRFENLRISDKYKLNELLDGSLNQFQSVRDFKIPSSLGPVTNFKILESLSDETRVRLLDKVNEMVNQVPRPTPPPIAPIETVFVPNSKSDAILVVQGKKLHVNQALLSYHSDYFNTLFNSHGNANEDWLKVRPVTKKVGKMSRKISMIISTVRRYALRFTDRAASRDAPESTPKTHTHVPLCDPAVPEFNVKSMGEIKIKDVDFENFATLLSLIDVRRISPTDKNAEKLLELADRFRLLPSVKYLVELYLIKSKIDVKEKIRIADKYQLEALLKTALAKIYTTTELKDWSYEGFSTHTKSLIFKQMVRFF